MTANYTFVNERLARHYGIPNIYGDHFRRVTFDDGKRGGLLGQAGILAVTSYPNRTHRCCGESGSGEPARAPPPPPPPAEVPALKDAGEEGQPRSDSWKDGSASEEIPPAPVSRAYGSPWGSRSRIMTRSGNGAPRAMAFRSKWPRAFQMASQFRRSWRTAGASRQPFRRLCPHVHRDGS